MLQMCSQICIKDKNEIIILLPEGYVELLSI